MNRKALLAVILGAACMISGCGKKEEQAPAQDASLEAQTEVKTKAQDETEAIEKLSEEALEAVEEESEMLEEAAAEEAEEAIAERPEYTALDYVTLGTYKGLALTVSPVTVTEEQIDAQIDVLYQSSTLEDLYEEITDGTVEMFDTVNIDFVGKVDGEAFDGGSAEGYDLGIGSGAFIPGFEEGLVGAKAGETVDVPVTFPAAYQAAELAGKDAVFTVTINSIRRPKPLSDEIASELSSGTYTTVDEFRQYVRESLQASGEAEQENGKKEELMAQVYNTCTVNDYPQELVDYTVQGLVSTYTGYAEMYGMSFEEFLSGYMQMSEEEFMTAAEGAAKETLTQELILKAIAEQENITISEEEFEQGCTDYAAAYGYEDAEDLKSNYDSKVIEISLLMDKVLAFLEDNAVIEEVTETEALEEVLSESMTEALTE